MYTWPGNILKDYYSVFFHKHGHSQLNTLKCAFIGRHEVKQQYAVEGPGPGNYPAEQII